MKYSFLSLGMILAGMFGLVFVVTFESITINNESDYYSLKESMEASMLEAVDLQCYRLPKAYGGCGGDIKISEQKFVENFVKRFGANLSGDADEYTIDFYDIIESPPKATVVITSSTDGTSSKIDLGSEEGFNIKNALSGVLESYTIVNGDLESVEDEVIEDEEEETGSCVELVTYHYNVPNKALIDGLSETKTEHSCGDSYRFPNLKNPTGYILDYWSTAAGDGGISVTNTDSIDQYGNNVYAHWIDTSTLFYNVTYYANGGTGNVSGAKINYGKSYTVLDNGFTFTGHSFKAWNTQSNGTGHYYYKNDVINDIKNHISLYAVWDYNKYAINYTLNNGSYGAKHPNEGTYDSVVYIDNPTKSITVAGNVNGTGANVGANTTNSQTFTGWTASSLYSGAKIGTSNNPTTAWLGTATKNKYFKNLRDTGSVTLVANWSGNVTLPTLSKNGGYTCSWYDAVTGGNKLGGSGASVNITDSSKSTTFNVYARCTKDATPTPTKAPTATPTKAPTKTPTATPKPQYTVNVSKGSSAMINKAIIGTSGDIISKSFESGTSVTVSAKVNNYYHFDGWYNGSTRVSTDSTYTFTVNSNITLVAKGLPNELYIHYCWKSGRTTKVYNSTSKKYVGIASTSVETVTIPNLGESKKCDKSVQKIAYNSTSCNLRDNAGVPAQHYCITDGNKVGDNNWDYYYTKDDRYYFDASGNKCSSTAFNENNDRFKLLGLTNDLKTNPVVHRYFVLKSLHRYSDNSNRCK